MNENAIDAAFEVVDFRITIGNTWAMALQSAKYTAEFFEHKTVRSLGSKDQQIFLHTCDDFIFSICPSIAYLDSVVETATYEMQKVRTSHQRQEHQANAVATEQGRAFNRLPGAEAHRANVNDIRQSIANASLMDIRRKWALLCMKEQALSAAQQTSWLDRPILGLFMVAALRQRVNIKKLARAIIGVYLLNEKAFDINLDVEGNIKKYRALDTISQGKKDAITRFQMLTYSNFLMACDEDRIKQELSITFSGLKDKKAAECLYLAINGTPQDGNLLEQLRAGQDLRAAQGSQQGA